MDRTGEKCNPQVAILRERSRIAPPRGDAGTGWMGPRDATCRASGTSAPGTNGHTGLGPHCQADHGLSSRLPPGGAARTRCHALRAERIPKWWPGDHFRTVSEASAPPRPGPSERDPQRRDGDPRRARSSATGPWGTAAIGTCAGSWSARVAAGRSVMGRQHPGRSSRAPRRARRGPSAGQRAGTAGSCTRSPGRRTRGAMSWGASPPPPES